MLALLLCVVVLARAQVANPSFEDGDNGLAPPSWTVTTYLNINGFLNATGTLQTFENLQLDSGGTNLTFTYVNNSGPFSSESVELAGYQTSLRWPFVGNKVALVNQGGIGNNVNQLSQTFAIDSTFVGQDGTVQFYFATAPVVQNPNHLFSQQPFTFVYIQNKRTGQVLVSDFQVSGDPDNVVPWIVANPDEGDDLLYTNWQIYRVQNTSSTPLAIGDQIFASFMAAGCNQGGHFAELYVDGPFGPNLNFLSVQIGSACLDTLGNIVFQLNYANPSSGPKTDVLISFTTPPGTTFAYVNKTTQLASSCSVPAAGTSGTVNCTFTDALPSGVSGSFAIAVALDQGSTQAFVQAYSITSAETAPVLGPAFLAVAAQLSACPTITTTTTSTTVTEVAATTSTGPDATEATTTTTTTTAAAAATTTTSSGAGAEVTTTASAAAETTTTAAAAATTTTASGTRAPIVPTE